MTDVHLIAGSTGAGKSTYARSIETECGAVRFSIDAWMTTLFWADCPLPVNPEWAMARVERCYTQIWAIAADVARRGVPVILDLGFTTRTTRARPARASLRWRATPGCIHDCISSTFPPTSAGGGSRRATRRAPAT
jgi:predicted kinase